MPPRKRAETHPDTDDTASAGVDIPEASAAEEKPQTAARKKAPAVCETCFPSGWPADPTVTAVGCEHGSWTR